MSPGDLHPDRPHSARIYDFLLGGKDNFEADRAAAAQMLQHVIDDGEARDIIGRLMAPLPAGSALALSAVTVENDPDGGPGTVKTYNQNGVPVVARTRTGVEGLFAGFDLVSPGVVPVHHWRPTDEDRGVDDAAVYMYGGVAFKR